MVKVLDRTLSTCYTCALLRGRFGLGRILSESYRVHRTPDQQSLEQPVSIVDIYEGIEILTIEGTLGSSTTTL